MFRFHLRLLSIFCSFFIVLSRLQKYTSPYYSRYHLILPEGIFEGSTVEYYGIAYLTFGQLASRPQIQFHADLDYITFNQIFVNEDEVKEYQYNTTNKIVNVTVPNNVIKNNGLMLYINYTSRVSVSDTYGIYRAQYQSGNEKKYFLASRFQPIFARRVLPCLDEPTFSSSFEFYVSHPKTVSVLANRLGDIVDISDVHYFENSTLVTTRLNSTSDMTPHNLGFVISSEFTCTALDNSKDVTSVDTFRLCSRGDEVEENRNFALKKAAELIQALNSYTNWPYSLIGVQKLDFVAVPDYPIDCSAYKGLILCREDLLLANEKVLTQETKTKMIKNLARQLSQMWFGNRIVNQWWNDKFLYVDAFAGYFEYFLTNELYPEMDLKNYFLTQIIPQVFVEDSYKSSEKLQGDAFESDQDVLNQYQKKPSYKGAFLLHMIEDIMGSEAFKKGIQNFVPSITSKSPTVMSLWNALDVLVDSSLLPTRSSRLYEIMDSWTTQPGFPLVHIKVDEGSLYPYKPRKILFSQERLMYDSTNETAKWFVPLSYTLSSDTAQFSNKTPKLWLNLSSSQEIRYPWTEEFAVFNNQLAGFYIVDMDDTLWNNVTKTLNDFTEFATIPEVSKSKILFDAFEMVKINRRNYTEVFAMVEYLKNEESFYPWMIALKEFEFLLSKVGHKTALGKAVSDHILRLLTTIYNTVPWSKITDDDHQYTEKQVQILKVACELGHDDCIQNALAAKEGQTDSLLNLKGIIYCTQLKYGKNSTQWTELMDIYQKSNDLSTRSMILDSLACVEDKDLLLDLLSLTIEKHTSVTIQEGLTIFKSIISHDNLVGTQVALNFLRDNNIAIQERYGGSQNLLTTIIEGLTEKVSYADKNLIFELRTFIENFNFPQNFKTSINSACDKALSSNVWLEKHWEELHEYYHLDKDETSTSTTSTSTTSGTITTETTEPPSNKAFTFPNSIVVNVILSILTYCNVMLPSVYCSIKS